MFICTLRTAMIKNRVNYDLTENLLFHKMVQATFFKERYTTHIIDVFNLRSYKEIFENRNNPKNLKIYGYEKFFLSKVALKDSN